MGTTTFSGFWIVTSSASAYIRIVTDFFHIADSRVLGVLSCGMVLEPYRPPNSAVCGSELFAVEVDVKMRGTFILLVVLRNSYILHLAKVVFVKVSKSA